MLLFSGVWDNQRLDTSGNPFGDEHLFYVFSPARFLPLFVHSTSACVLVLFYWITNVRKLPGLVCFLLVGTSISIGSMYLLPRVVFVTALVQAGEKGKEDRMMPHGRLLQYAPDLLMS